MARLYIFLGLLAAALVLSVLILAEAFREDGKRPDGKNKKMFLAVLLIPLLAAAFASCSAKTEETPPAGETGIYGDPVLGISPEADKSLKDFDTYLLMGIDDGKRSDVMIVISVNKETGKSTAVSIDRDAYMQVKDGELITVENQDYEFYKCNRGYQRGGIEGVRKMLNRHLDLNIRKCIAIDWEGAASLIDALGGLEADVDEKMLSWINESSQLWDLADRDEYKIRTSGHQTLNGWQAVQYLRVRKYEGGNARVRAERNEKAAWQLLEKANALSEDETAELYLDLSEHIDTNAGFEVLAELFGALSENMPDSAGVWPYEYKTMWDSNMHFYYRVPVTLESNAAELHEKLYGQADYVPADECRTLSERIEELAEELVED